MFEMQDSSNFKFPLSLMLRVGYPPSKGINIFD